MGNRTKKKIDGARRGLTLIELMVAIVVVLLLVSVALPLLTPGRAARRIREASRSINVFFGAARAKAMELGREVGVALERDPTNLSVCTRLFQVDTPAPYAGETQSSRVRVRWLDAGRTKLQAMPYDVATGNTAGVLMPTLINVGDMVDLNGHGVFYTVLSKGGQGEMVLQCVTNCAMYAPWPMPTDSDYSAPVPFAIYRQPTFSAEAAPLILPKATAVDLGEFGSGRNVSCDFARTSGNQVVNDRVMILFSPQGSVSRLLLVPVDKNPLSVVSLAANDPIVLLVGERTRVGVRTPPAATEIPNWAAVDSLWVTLIPQTGLIRAAENVPTDAVNLGSSGGWLSQMTAARIFALGNRKSGNTDLGAVEDVMGGR